MKQLFPYRSAQHFALRAHSGVFYEPEHIPYSIHLYKVAHITNMVYDGNYHLSFATGISWLHDVIEDTNYTPEDILVNFGSDVCNSVQALTKNKTLSKPDQMADSLLRIKKQPKETAIVKMADRIANLSNPQTLWTTERKQYYMHEACIILFALSYASKPTAVRLENEIEKYTLSIN